jgi:inorganic phosphate transporter, PiT family
VADPLVLVVLVALGFDFINGFHDTAIAMASSIATGAFRVAVAAVLNLAGAFLSLSVAATLASGLVETGPMTLTVVLAGLTGGITEHADLVSGDPVEFLARI